MTSQTRQRGGETYQSPRKVAEVTEKAVAQWPISYKPIRVAIVATEDAQALDVAGPHEVFSLARRQLQELNDQRGRGYEVEVFKIGKGRLLTGVSGLPVLSDGSYRKLRGPIDTLLVVGGLEPQNLVEKEPVLEWLRELVTKVRRLGSISTGAFVLAAAGLLNGRRATTHWKYCQQLANQYPQVSVDPEPIFVRDGNIYTTAGVTTGMDLALALVEEDFGNEVAVRIAKACVMLLRRSAGCSQVSTLLAFKTSSHSALHKLQRWILEHLDESLPLQRLALQVNMSSRNFSRVFVRESGLTPGEYVARVRVEAARKRLEETNDGVEEIAAKTGFRTAETMRRTFLRVLKVTPTDYRSRFNGGRRRGRL